MTVVSITSAKRANSDTATSCGESRKGLRFIADVMQTAQTLWPRKTATELSVRTGIKQRACEYWLERKSGMSAESLAMLLRTDEGLQILETVMGDARPAWWRAFKRTVRRAELRRQQTMLAKAIEENEQSELDL